jgi:hypothetical protein
VGGEFWLQDQLLTDSTPIAALVGANPKEFVAVPLDQGACRSDARQANRSATCLEKEYSQT